MYEGVDGDCLEGISSVLAYCKDSTHRCAHARHNAHKIVSSSSRMQYPAAIRSHFGAHEDTHVQLCIPIRQDIKRKS